MKNNKPKKLPKTLETICDYNKTSLSPAFGDTTPTETDPTTATVTIIITTANSHKAGRILM